MQDFKHEEVGQYRGRLYRWCKYCNCFHGYLYACPHFSKECQELIRKTDRKVLGLSASVALLIIFIVMLLVKIGV
jgi:hypothetical protein